MKILTKILNLNTEHLTCTVRITVSRGGLDLILSQDISSSSMHTEPSEVDRVEES